MLTSFLGATYVTFLFVTKQKRFAVLCENLENFNEFGKPYCFDVENNKLNFYSIFCSHYCNLAIFVYACVSLLNIPKCEKYNENYNVTDVCGQFFPAKLPFIQLNRSPVKQIFFIYQLFATTLALKSSAMVSFMTFETCGHIMIRIRHLKSLLRHVFDDKNNQKERLHLCVKYHNDIIKLFQDFNSCSSGGMGIHVVITGAVLGCLTNQLVQEWTLGPVMHFGGWFMALFVVCHGGQMITSEVRFIIVFIYIFFSK